MTMHLKIEEVSYTSSKEWIHKVRYTVFVIEQNVPPELEFDDQDPVSIHVLASINAAPVGTGRLAPDGKIGRMAVLKNFREKGIGGKILSKLIKIGREKGIGEFYLSAQCHAIPFYEKMGFIPEGPTYLEAGIDHRLMRRAQLKFAKCGNEAAPQSGWPRKPPEGGTPFRFKMRRGASSLHVRFRRNPGSESGAGSEVRNPVPLKT